MNNLLTKEMVRNEEATTIRETHYYRVGSAHSRRVFNLIKNYVVKNSVKSIVDELDSYTLVIESENIEPTAITLQFGEEDCVVCVVFDISAELGYYNASGSYPIIDLFNITDKGRRYLSKLKELVTNI